jgi:ferredoxin/rubrerythrin
MTLELDVRVSRCSRCGACATLCPGVFDVSAKTSRVVREPVAAERVLVEAARWICPTDAIGVSSSAEESAALAADPDVTLFDELAATAERVRWTLDAVPWRDVDGALAPAGLRTMVREMAFSEGATYSATQRFMESFFDDVDFSKWISVWFYEETRHPHLLMEWLRRVGEPVQTELVLKGRVSTPFMQSLVGTLVTNVISEVTAAQAYRRLARRSREPVIALIADLIARDEARHAASFFRFARKRLAATPQESARRDRARGLEILQAWLGGARTATHPVAQMLERLEEGADEDALDLGLSSVRTRVVRVVGLLLDLPLGREEDVVPLLRQLLAGRTS